MISIIAFCRFLGVMFTLQTLSPKSTNQIGNAMITAAQSSSSSASEQEISMNRFVTIWAVATSLLLGHASGINANPAKPTSFGSLTPTWLAQAAIASEPVVTPSTTSEYTVEIDGIDRSYLVYLPSNYDGATNLPVVLLFHGFSGKAADIIAQGHWRQKAEQEGFIIVALNGKPKVPELPADPATNPRSWNDGGLTDAGVNTANDVGFTNAVIDQLEANFAVDRDRIYAAGFSNGAAMTWRVGAALSHRIAAIAPVSNALLAQVKTLALPVSALLIWGTADPITPINGGDIYRAGQITHRPSAEYSWQTWGQMLNCAPDAQTIYDQDGVWGRSFNNCQADSTAEYYMITGFDHNWPGYRNALGSTSDGINATDLIWDFFVKHPRVTLNSAEPTTESWADDCTALDELIDLLQDLG
jgi:polyhydroxybutyrate depolymerase